MNKVQFPWTESEKINADEIIELENTKERGWKKALKYKEFIPLILCLALIAAVKIKEQTEPKAIQAPPVKHNLDVLISMLPQKKGEAINTNILKAIAVSESDISKREKLILLRRDDLKKLPNGIFLKKDLPPRKPISWKDLSIKKNPSKRAPVIYRGE